MVYIFYLRKKWVRFGTQNTYQKIHRFWVLNLSEQHRTDRNRGVQDKSFQKVKQTGPKRDKTKENGLKEKKRQTNVIMGKWYQTLGWDKI